MPRPGAARTTKNARAAPFEVGTRNDHASTEAGMSVQPALGRANAVTTGQSGVSGLAAKTHHGRDLPGAGMKALATACAERSKGMRAIAQRVHPIDATAAPMTAVGNAANDRMTAVAMATSLRAHPTAVPIEAMTGPTPVNRVLTSAAAMTEVGGAATGPTAAARNATSPPIGRDRAVGVHPSASRKPSPTMCGSIVSSPMLASAAAARPMISLWRAP